MTKTTKAQRAAKLEVERAQVRATKTEIIEKLAGEAKDWTILNSVNYGKIEAWNLAECYRQNAESDGNELVAHVECALSDESEEVGAYFRALGFNF